ncbi:MAG: tripartite tricarboxylate transporter substrate binding protein [Bradyrhizobium sp.]|nr:tripartite tricarboxylate transporter substrate binding protein [Bradyrhizobium sp.]
MDPKNSSRLTRRALLSMLAAAPMIQGARAESYPERPVRIVVPYAAGGATDVIGRLIAQSLTDRLGKSFFVENRGGANGMIGTQAVATSAKDGYNLLVVASSHPIMGALYPSITYDPIKDFAPVALVAGTPYVLVVPPDLPVKTLREFIEYAQKNAGKISYASAGMGTSQHLGAELLKRTAGFEMLHVPYKGSGAARSDLLSGRVQFMMDNISILTQSIEKGDLRALAVTSKTRTSLLPDVPTVAESGVPNFEIEGWFGLLAPAETPSNIVKQLNATVNAMLVDPGSKAQFAPLGAIPLGGSPEAFDIFMNAEKVKWTKIIKDANIRTE